MPLDMNYVRGQADHIAKEQAEGGADRRNISNYDFKNGQNRGRLLPPWPGSGELAMHVFHHFGLPNPYKHAFCWENIFPGRGIQCPVCQKLREIKARGIECWRQGAVDIPRTNWIDRMPLNQFGQPLPLEQHPGVQIVDLKIGIFNYFIGMAAQTGADLTSTDQGYDVLINFDGKVQKDPGIFPGLSPLAPSHEIAQKWVAQLYDIRKLVKMPDWSSPDGRKAWEKLCQAAMELERSYLQSQSVMVGGGFPGQAPGAPQFSQPSAPPPQYQAPPQAPPPQFTQPSAPQYANPGAMGNPGEVPFGAPPPMAPPPAQPPAQQQFAPPPAPAAPMPPQMPPAAPVQQTFAPPPPAMTAPTQPPPFAPPPPAAPQAPQFAPGGQNAGPMPPPPAMPAPAASTAPPWEQQQPAPPPAAAPPQAPPAAAPPVMTATSADGKPVCFSQSRMNLSVVYGQNGQAPIRGGWSDKPDEVGYRCTMCPHDLECGAKAKATYPQDYVVDAAGNYPPRPTA